MSDFTHLHVHTQYSLLDGANKVDALISKIKEMGMDSLAITDHGNMYGAIDFYRRAREMGIKPIIGCEVYVAPKSMKEKVERTNYHLVLLAKDNIGYQNLIYLVSCAFIEGFYYNPRIDNELLAKHKDGLIALSACLGGEIPSLILENKIEEAKAKALFYRGLFGDDGFFLEIQKNNLPEQEIVNRALIEISSETGIPVIATGDCHYLKKEDATAHEILVCIQTGKTIHDEKRMQAGSDQFYVKSIDEMVDDWKDLPEAISNTKKIADMCNVEIKTGETYLPKFSVNGGETPESYLEKIALQGFNDRFTNTLSNEEYNLYEERLNHELKVINSMGFASYFLIVWDFIKYARDKDIPVGPGRGSGAGSLVAYTLKITDIDPLKYNLLFERFLNPERISMPDFDIDFCKRRRDEVIDYVTNKYGKDHVAQIITYGVLKAKSVIRDVGRVLAIPYGEVDRIAKMVPDILNITLRDALIQSEDLRKIHADSKYKNLIDYSLTLEGLYRHAGVHAAGIVISEEPLWKYTPICKVTESERVTQFSKDEVEKVGLVKFDFLGLKTLTVIFDTVKLITRIKNFANFDISKVPLDDRAVYETLTSGKTTGIFQLESPGFQELLKKIKPDRIADLIAAVALYRPGPIQSGMLDDFWKRKHGIVKVTYPDPILEDILKETYGVIVYQEQVMKIAERMAGFSLGQADILRKAMGKKLHDVMERQREIFITKASERGIRRDTAAVVFDLMAKFAEYGFNKSHSTAYALISYQTAYLKTHFPKEFMAALLTSEKEDLIKIGKYAGDAVEMGINILPPSLNKSMGVFTVEGDAIRYGLSAIKNVGDIASEYILEKRKNDYESFMGFLERMDLRIINKKVLESLIKCGAFDFSVTSRASLFNVLDEALQEASKIQKARESKQLNIFNLLNENGECECQYENLTIKDLPEWDTKYILKEEKELTGLYFSGHPLSDYNDIISKLSTMPLSMLDKETNGKHLLIGGIITTKNIKLTKNGEKMAIIFIEDESANAQVIVFPSLYRECSEILESDEPLWIEGTVSTTNDFTNVRAEKIHRFDNLLRERFRKTKLTVTGEELEKKINFLKDILKEHRGETPFFIDLLLENQKRMILEAGDDYNVTISVSLKKSIEALFSKKSLAFLS